MNKRVMYCDLLVVGSGAAGLSAAVTAAWSGLSVVVVEKDDVFGGASAWSGGWMWVPGNPLAKRAGIHEDPEQPRQYLKNELGRFYNHAKIDAFLDKCPEMISFFEDHTELQFADGNHIPDMHGATPGAAIGGHQVIAAPYDGRSVGGLIRRLRKTMPETSIFGMPIMAGSDLAAFLKATRSLTSAWYVAKRLTRHFMDLVIHGRAMQLVNGVALIARLAKSAEKLGVQLIESAPAKQLIAEGGAVRGAIVSINGRDVEVHASKGVVLAAGGFANDCSRRQAFFPPNTLNTDHLALPPDSCNGEGLTLGEQAGGSLDTDLASPAAWAPVSRIQHRNGRIGHFPHIIDRAKPGVIGVLANGKRFVNEANGYYDYTTAMIAATPAGQEVASWLICDHRFQRHYGLGYARPFPFPITSYIKSGYLKRGSSVEQLAKHCGIDPVELTKTVRAYNTHAAAGQDPLFGRGTTPFNCKGGDPEHGGTNPCVAPIEKGPFYAVKVLPGSFGTFVGLKTNAQAQVLDSQNLPITGLYAAGADMVSVMGGYYPSGGINLGPAMTFGYIAGRHAADKTTPTP